MYVGDNGLNSIGWLLEGVDHCCACILMNSKRKTELWFRKKPEVLVLACPTIVDSNALVPEVEGPVSGPSSQLSSTISRNLSAAAV